ncbi:ATPase [Ligilactobacillus pobuzihii]|uniref:ABC-ATPase domain-containing protein n=1 Tax=Ligilactobacillus pobuzihii TaxID=449659 RepID=UPI0019CFC9BB|nr:ABC-ATPase domain-containing protein [Ligilactobacillus pobuzihii]MBN7274667.1 ATPase [Ligilactobacillus pobuzihii]
MENLEKKLLALDGKGYGGYKSLAGSYSFPLYTLVIDHIQADPFAPPSTMHVVIKREKTRLPANLLDIKDKRLAVADFLQRNFAQQAQKNKLNTKGTGHSGQLYIDSCGQEILERTAIVIGEQNIEARFEVGLPAAGRRIKGKEALRIFNELLPRIVQNSLLYTNIDQAALKNQVELFLEQQEIRQQMRKQNLVAFVANGAILPRASGSSDLPLQKGTPFRSPNSMEVTFKLSNGKKISGMGIGQGITLIVGGGYHGKSTLLRALDVGVYDHIKDDGREFVLTDKTAMKIRAEDGRSVTDVNITPFINHIPGRRDTSSFSTVNASGSTSQAANVIEALESGTKTLLIDEDTSATNFMIRDARMQRLVSSDKESITPFVDKIKALFNQHGVSTILVTGGSGDYFEIADRIIMMNEYQPGDVTKRAREIAEMENSHRSVADEQNFGSLEERIPKKGNFRIVSRKDRFKVRNKTEITFGHTTINLDALEQLTDPSQTRGIVALLQILKANYFNDQTSFAQMTEKLYADIQQQGLDQVLNSKRHPGNIALPRRQELCAAINRYRGLHVIKK